MLSNLFDGLRQTNLYIWQDRTLQLVVPLVHCCVEPYESSFVLPPPPLFSSHIYIFHVTRKKKIGFAINGRLNTSMFGVISGKEEDLKPWISAVQQAIEDVEVHATRIFSGKKEIRGRNKVLAASMDYDSDSDDESTITEGCMYK